MPNKMLIDASHKEETRVVVVRGNRIEEFDFESQDKKQLKGNIYLARVTRVEPSLQAAFVEYGGNRHGFLAFSEIHPDYYQIPVADRQALLRAEAEAAQAEDDDDDEERSNGRNRRRRRGGRGRPNGQPQEAASNATASDEAADDGEQAGTESADDESDAVPAQAHGTDDAAGDESGGDDTGGDDADSNDAGGGAMAARVDADTVSEDVPSASREDDNGNGDGNGDSNGNGDDGEVDTVGAEDAIEEARDRRRPVRRQYKIQEVIKRRQILLVQVVKEERGNKGAALTTYLSLAGRYSVLMPNTARGGGISRKITNAQDRKRLKDVVKDLEVPQGMGVILRTAGESRTKAEIKRDYEYLMRLWDNVRTRTLESTAPALVYEEGSLIKRSVRDLYNKDIDEILVAGEEGYREAKDFMRMLMPSHAKSVQPYRDNVPLFVRHGMEAQLDRMVQPQVTLKSGGYIIINQTEALVAIDVNSGRSTREHSIEDTALQTNLEAAEEVARQLRLRDLAGLIVIDFIDMEENRNNRAVEKRIKDCLKNDRARIQVGRISHFGLLEMSRQRIRASVLESTMVPCPHCGGTGHVRSESSVALLVVRAIEEYLLRDSRNHVTVRTPASTAFYVLNNKRRNIADLEARFGLTITIEADEHVGSQHYAIVKGAVAEKPAIIEQPTIVPPPLEADEDDIVDVSDAEDAEEANEDVAAAETSEGDDQPRRKRRRRRRRGGRDRDGSESEAAHVADATADLDNGHAVEGVGEEGTDGEASTSDDEEGARRRRRGKRGGRRNRREVTDLEAQDAIEGVQPADAGESGGEDAEAETVVEAALSPEVTETESTIEAEAQDEAVAAETADAPAKPARKPRRSRAKPAAAAEESPAEAVEEPVQEPVQEAAEKPKRTRTPRRKKVAEPDAAPAEEAEAPTPAPQADEPVAQETAAPEPQPDAPASEEKPASAAEEDTGSTDETAQGEAQPRKTGWWQRRSFF